MAVPVVVKFTGELIPQTPQGLDTRALVSIAQQLLALPEYQVSVVIGGGNFFRGDTEKKITPRIAHYAGMLATVMNGLVIQDVFERQGIATVLFNALSCPEVGSIISPQALAQAQQDHKCIIFAGGTGNPFFTTDTNAVLRALQVGAKELWKMTKVDGVYTQDPHIYPHAQLLPRLTYSTALEQNLTVMDPCAFALAQGRGLTIRVFNGFVPQALLKAAQDKNFGSTITDK